MIARTDKKKKPSKRAKTRAATLKEQKKRAWMVHLMAQSLFKIIELKGPIQLSGQQIDSVPKDWLDQMQIQVKPEGVTFQLKKECVLELPPDKRIIV